SQASGNRVSLDLRRAGIEAGPDRIAQGALELAFRGVAVAAVDLDRIERRLHAALAHVELGHRRLELAQPSLLQEPSRLVEEKARGLVAELHVDDPVRHRLEAADRLPELLALAGVGDARFDLPLHGAELEGEDQASLPSHAFAED